MGRSIKKGPFIDQHLLDKIQVAKDNKSKTPIKTWSRRSMITPDFVGQTFNVHNGKVFNAVFVTENMVGYRLRGVFLPRNYQKYSDVRTEDARSGAADPGIAGAGGAGGTGVRPAQGRSGGLQDFEVR